MTNKKFFVRKNNENYSISSLNDSFTFSGNNLNELFKKASDKFDESRNLSMKHNNINYLINIYNKYLHNYFVSIMKLVLKTMFQIFLTMLLLYFIIFTIFQNIDDMASKFYNSLESKNLNYDRNLTKQEIKALEIYNYINKRLLIYNDYLNK